MEARNSLRSLREFDDKSGDYLLQHPTQGRLVVIFIHCMKNPAILKLLQIAFQCMMKVDLLQKIKVKVDLLQKVNSDC